jgi:hypothetical protein
LDDVLYNVIHDIVIKAHRDEKIAKANTAAIVVEQQAAEIFSDMPTPNKRSRLPPQHLETEAAVYENGLVTIKGNPLEHVHEIRCGKCGLVKLLHPTDGVGARKPEPGMEYCEKHPYIDKPGHDIYGVSFPKDDASSSKKQKAKTVLTLSASQNDADSSFESPGQSPSSEEPKPKQTMSFPNVQCPRCPRQVNIKVFARHLNSHLKSGGRASARAAADRISGQAGSGVNTPPASRTSTPATKVSPLKRPHDRIEEKYADEENEDASPQKKIRRIPQLKVNPPRVQYEGVVKKWKSGKITVDGKTVDQRPIPKTGIPDSKFNRGASGGSNGIRRTGSPSR